MRTQLRQGCFRPPSRLRKRWELETMSKHLSLLKPDGTPITGWQQWTRPKKPEHWKPGRSAMELAKAWFRKPHASPPNEFLKLLQSSERLTGIQLLRGVPELVTSLPERGEGRNHDLWLLAGTKDEQVTICVEAKADEAFGNETVSQYRQSAQKYLESGGRTKVPQRIDRMLSIVSGASDDWDCIRYQLLAALCGTVLQAVRDGSSIAVLVVHEFRTAKTTAEKLEDNEREFAEFMQVALTLAVPISSGTLYGPVKIDGIDILIGKIVT